MPGDFETPDHDEALALPSGPAAAFDQAQTGYALAGQPLHQYSDARKIAAQAMGLLWPAIGDAGQDQMRSNGLYAGAQKDAIIVLWLCSIKNASELDKEEVKAGVWNVQRASRAPREAFDRAVEWAGEQQLIDLTGSAFGHAYQVFLAIVIGVAVSEFEVEVPAEVQRPEGTHDPNA